MVNWAADSVESTVMLVSLPISFSAAMPAGIESWRNPAVLEKTRTRLAVLSTGLLESSKSSMS
ncbi:hypothetical protein SMICM17S_01935 [Streptomyces microflavus]